MKQTILHLLEMDFYSRKQFVKEKGSMLVEELVTNIGSIDEKLRNDYIQLFIELLTDDLFSNEQKTAFINQLTDENCLFHHIGENNTDSVFTRAYSAFYITKLLQNDYAQPFLTMNESAAIIEKCAGYLSKEQDVRGVIEGKGWANAIYFGAEMSCFMIKHPSFNIKCSPILLQGIKDCFWKGAVFVHDEEEQLVSMFVNLIKKNIQEDLLIEWVEQVFDKLHFYRQEVGYTPLYYAARTNILHFMKTLYFTLKFSNKMPELKGVVSIFIGKWMN